MFGRICKKYFGIPTIFILCALKASISSAADYGALVIGAYGEDLDTTRNAGVVHVIKTMQGGLSSEGNQLWYQGANGIIGAAEEDDHFGSSLATGDFNNDGYADLAVGVQDEYIGETIDAGVVNVIYGSAEGLSSEGNQMWQQGAGGIIGAAEEDDHFGSSLAAGDFNNDGYGDLAIGVPQEDIGETVRAGVVNVIYGSAEGLNSAGNQVWQQGTGGIIGAAEEDDHFGTSLTAGDFNNDGYADLAIGVPSENIGELIGAGVVNVIYGSAEGLSSAGNQMWQQGAGGIIGIAEMSDDFGSSLTAGDFNNDGYADLAVGVRGEYIGETTDAGVVNVIYGSAGGLSSAGNQMWQQGAGGIIGVAETYDHFGTSLTAGDFNNDGYADLAIGAHTEQIGAIVDAGAVNVIYGSAGGLSSAGNQVWQQGAGGIIGVAEDFDRFGSSLTAGDFNNDGYADLAIGVLWEDIGKWIDAGVVNVIYGSISGLTSTGNEMWSQDTEGVAGFVEHDDHFGSSLVFLPPHRSFPWSIYLLLLGDKEMP